MLGAGASFGDTLQFYAGYTGDTSQVPPNPPLTNQFFDELHINGDPKEVEEQHGSLFRHIRNHWGITEPLGSAAWSTLSIEDVFSSLALWNDFSPAGTDEKALSQLLLNQLTRYIRRSISFSTMFRFGAYAHTLARNLKAADSVINFNFDLLMDQEFLRDNDALQYQNFCVKFLGADLVKPGPNYVAVRQSLLEPVSPGSNKGPAGPMEGLYLKPHGSLNWFTCPNTACPKSRSFVVLDSVAQCLAVSACSIDFQ